MLACPNCSARLARRSTPAGVVYCCHGCGGRMAGVAVVRKDRAAGEFLNSVWQDAREGRSRSGRPCAHCARPMDQVDVPGGGGELAVDVCLRCSCIWFDPGEYSGVPRTLVANRARDHRLPPSVRKTFAIEKVKQMQREHERRAANDGPEEVWQYVPAFLGLPVECGAPGVTTRPLVTWGVAAFTALLFALTLWDLRAAVRGFGLVPAEWYRYGGLTVVSSFFLHGGIWHVLSNMYFLMVFGDNVEDDLGKRRFAGLLAAAHVAGMVLHTLLDPRSSVPCVGASAGVSGVIAYYAVAFPRARLGFMFFVFYRIRWQTVSAATAFAIWICIQLFGAWKQLGGFTNVSALAHLGGAAVGLAVALAVRMRRTPPAASRSRSPDTETGP